MSKEFTQSDVHNFDGEFPRIQADHTDLIDAQPEWMRRGLQQTATGYGRRLNTGRKISYCGRAYRLYATCFSNVASIWFTVRGKRIYVD